MTPRDISQKNLLEKYPISQFHQEYLKLFTWNSIHARAITSFNPKKIISHLNTLENGRKVWGIDLGGTNLLAVPWYVENGQLFPDERSIISLKSVSGQGYLSKLESIAQDAAEYNVPVGISFAGPVKEDKPEDAPNMKEFLAELGEKYEGRFSLLFPTLASCQNDAVAGLVASSIFVGREYPQVQYINYLINGTGIGGAGLTQIVQGDNKNNQYVVATEIGHVKVPDALNRFNVRQECGMFGASHTCLELVGGGKGIISTWKRKKREYLPGNQIAECLQQGDSFAGELYKCAADVTSLACLGLGNSLGMFHKKGDTIIIFHGGQFLVPGFKDHVENTITKNLSYKPQFLFTSEVVAYGCSQGAAITALTSDRSYSI